MPQMSVPQRVQTRLLQSISLLEPIVNHHLKENLQTDLAHAREAAALADAAYFDSSMIRQLYFPQEHMLGVFAPLLAPMILPLLLGFVREWKRYKLKKQTQRIKFKSAWYRCSVSWCTVVRSKLIRSTVIVCVFFSPAKLQTVWKIYRKDYDKRRWKEISTSR